MNNIFKNRKRFWLFPLRALSFLLLGGFIVMLLWNAILPTVVAGIGYITYPKAIGLIILCRVLFGNFKGKSKCRKCSSHENPDKLFWQEKIVAMTPEDRENFKTEWANRCNKK